MSVDRVSFLSLVVSQRIAMSVVSQCMVVASHFLVVVGPL